MSNSTPKHDSPECLRICEHLKHARIRPWTKENFLFPGISLAIATLTYTVTLAVITELYGGSIYLGGDLAGPGGALLLAVMLASITTQASHLREFLASLDLRAKDDSIAEVQKLDRINDRNIILQFIVPIAAIGLSILQGCVEHRLVLEERFWCTALIVLGNILLMVAALIFFRSCLYDCNYVVMIVEAREAGESNSSISKIQDGWENPLKRARTKKER